MLVFLNYDPIIVTFEMLPILYELKKNKFMESVNFNLWSGLWAFKRE